MVAIVMQDSTKTFNDVYGTPIGFLARALSVVGDQGYSTEAILREFQVSEKKLSDAGNRISSGTYFSILDYILIKLQIKGFGLLQASAEHFSDYGLMGTAFVASDNLRVASNMAIKFRRLYSPAAEYFTDFSGPQSSIVCLGVENRVRHLWSIENVLAGWANIIRLSLDDGIGFTEVRMTVADPGYAELYERIFRCPVRYEQERNELVFPKKLLSIAFPNANAELRDLCVNQCDKAVTKMISKEHLRDEVEGIILCGPQGVPKLPAVAEALCMSQRTLHRRLAELGTSYREILEELRSRMAREYLSETNLEPKEIAYLLGYSELANFYHAFSRWFGCTPLEFRSEAGPKVATG